MNLVDYKKLINPILKYYISSDAVDTKKRLYKRINKR